MTTPAITTLRSTLATDLTNAGVWSVFAYPPENILANSVVVVPADPYITPNNNTYISIAPMANFRVLMTCPIFDNQGNLNQIETMAYAVIQKLEASALVMNIGNVSAPSILSVASGDLLSCDVSVSILSSWE